MHRNTAGKFNGYLLQLLLSVGEYLVSHNTFGVIVVLVSSQMRNVRDFDTLISPKSLVAGSGKSKDEHIDQVEAWGNIGRAEK
jgi:hypothetical protein